MKTSRKAAVTAMIKSQVFNKWRAKLYNQFKNRKMEMNPLEVAELFKDFYDAHQHLNAIKRERKYRAQVDKLRAERGWKKKKKTPKELSPVPVNKHE